MFQVPYTPATNTVVTDNSKKRKYISEPYPINVVIEHQKWEKKSNRDTKLSTHITIGPLQN